MDWTSGLGGVGGRAGQARTERFRGLRDKKTQNQLILSFFGAGRGVPGRGRQRRELGGGS